jgi:hypothetical protein
MSMSRWSGWNGASRAVVHLRFSPSVSHRRSRSNVGADLLAHSGTSASTSSSSLGGLGISPGHRTPLAMPARSPIDARTSTVAPIRAWRGRPGMTTSAVDVFVTVTSSLRHPAPERRIGCMPAGTSLKIAAIPQSDLPAQRKHRLEWLASIRPTTELAGTLAREVRFSGAPRHHVRAPLSTFGGKVSLA